MENADILKQILSFSIDSLVGYRNCRLVNRQWDNTLQPVEKWFMDCKLFYDKSLYRSPEDHSYNDPDFDRLQHVWELVIKSKRIPVTRWDGNSIITPFHIGNLYLSDIPFIDLYKPYITFSYEDENECHCDVEDLVPCNEKLQQTCKHSTVPDLVENMWRINISTLLEPFGVSTWELNYMTSGFVAEQHYDIVRRIFVDSEKRRCLLITWKDTSCGFVAFLQILRLYDLLKCLDPGCILEIAQFQDTSAAKCYDKSKTNVFSRATGGRKLEEIRIKDSHMYWALLRVPYQKPSEELERTVVQLNECAKTKTEACLRERDWCMYEGLYHTTEYTLGPSNWGRLLYEKHDEPDDDSTKARFACGMWNIYAEICKPQTTLENMKLLAEHKPKELISFYKAFNEIVNGRRLSRLDCFELVQGEYRKFLWNRNIQDAENRIRRKRKYDVSILENQAEMHAEFHRKKAKLEENAESDSETSSDSEDYTPEENCEWFKDECYAFSLSFLKSHLELLSKE